MSTPQILITTPDYLPQLGGLTTYTQNIEETLKDLNISYELFHWNSIDEIKQYENPNRFDFIINIHFMGGFYLPAKFHHCRHINIYHGSELFFTSANMIKKIIKKLIRPQMISYISNCYQNIFISSYTQNLAHQMGLTIDYARDIIFHNCIDLQNRDFINLPLNHELQLCSIIRNTPHKNLKGCIELAENIQAHCKKSVTLTLPFHVKYTGSIQLNCIEQMSDKQREEIYKKSHFNLLLSLDHSTKGFIEGFGLSCLEAAKYGTPSIALSTGGLPDNIHPQINGYLLSGTRVEDIQSLIHEFSSEPEHYQQLRHSTYNHTIESHGLNQYSKLFKKILK